MHWCTDQSSSLVFAWGIDAIWKHCFVSWQYWLITVRSTMCFQTPDSTALFTIPACLLQIILYYKMLRLCVLFVCSRVDSTPSFRRTGVDTAGNTVFGHSPTNAASYHIAGRWRCLGLARAESMWAKITWGSILAHDIQLYILYAMAAPTVQKYSSPIPHL